jgi:ribosome-associated protein
LQINGPPVDRASYGSEWHREQAVDEMRKVIISKEPVELYKILKFESLASSGGEAKSVIAEGRVSINGAVETRKRRKIVSGDIVEFGEEKIYIQLEENISKVLT